MVGSLGVVLKELRKKKKLTAKETADRLSSLGYEISEKTISGYETGIRMPNADVFMALCTIYDCKNILEMFSFIKADYSIPTDSEWEMVEKYRFISTHSPDGASVVDTVLDREYAIADKLREQKEQLEKIQKMDMEVAEEIVPLRLWAYYGKIACAGTGFIFDDIPSDTIEAPYRNDADFIIGVNGDSMEPDYSDGEKLYVKKTDHISQEEVGIFTINNECFLKEYGEYGLVSKNKKYDDIPGNEDVRLIGKVVGKVEE